MHGFLEYTHTDVARPTTSLFHVANIAVAVVLGYTAAMLVPLQF